MPLEAACHICQRYRPSLLGALLLFLINMQMNNPHREVASTACMETSLICNWVYHQQHIAQWLDWIGCGKIEHVKAYKKHVLSCTFLTSSRALHQGALTVPSSSTSKPCNLPSPACNCQARRDVFDRYFNTQPQFMLFPFLKRRSPH